jgi:hypothetical protein
VLRHKAKIPVENMVRRNAPLLAPLLDPLLAPLLDLKEVLQAQDPTTGRPGEVARLAAQLG